MDTRAARSGTDSHHARVGSKSQTKTRPRRPVKIFGALVLVVVAGASLRGEGGPTAVQPATLAPVSAVLLVMSPFERALRAARSYRTRGRLAVNRELEALEVLEPEGAATLPPETLRLLAMSRDGSGDLRRA